MFCVFYEKISDRKPNNSYKNTCNSLAFFSKTKIKNVTKHSQKISLKIAFDEAFYYKLL